MQKALNLIISQTINDRLNWEDHSNKSFVCFEAREGDFLLAAQEGMLYCYLNHKEIARFNIPDWERLIKNIELSIARKQELRYVLVSLLHVNKIPMFVDKEYYEYKYVLTTGLDLTFIENLLDV